MTAQQAILVKVADGMKAEVETARNDGLFTGLQFNAFRSYADWRDDDLDELAGLQLDFVPVAYDSTDLEDRGACGYIASVDLAIRQKFGEQHFNQARRIKIELVDRLILFVEELHEFFVRADSEDHTELGRRLTTFPDASWRETKIKTTFSRRHLRDLKMFLGVLRCSWDVSKAL